MENWHKGEVFAPGRYGLSEVISVACDGAVIAHVNCSFGDGEEKAALISAVPELLHACELALALVKDTWIADHGSEQVGIAWGALHTAILKATGKAPTYARFIVHHGEKL